MTFTQRNLQAPPEYDQAQARTEANTPINVEIFFTRDGKIDGGWNLHEERDERDEPHGVEGLEGQNDLFPAVGVFGAVEFEVRFLEREWLFRPKV